MIEALLAGLFGLLIGSFLNVCIYRLPNDLSVVRPRSHCPQCKRMIVWYDNVPLLSYLFLQGKCRYCRAVIPLRYPLVELLTALSFFSAVMALGFTLDAARLCVFCAILIALFFSDLEERILPDEFTLGGTVVALIFAWFVPVRGIFGISLLDSAIAAAFSAGTLWTVGFLYKKLRKRDGLGLGDVKMVGMIGAFLGLEGVLLTLLVGSTMGSLIGLAYIAITRRDASSYELPFGTFLAAAALLVAFWEAVAR